MTEIRTIKLDNGARIRWGFVQLSDLLRFRAGEPSLQFDDGHPQVFSIEVFIPKGPTFLYGGLEARNAVDFENRFQIDAQPGQIVIGALADQLDTVYSGLLPEFFESMQTTLEHLQSTWNLALTNAIYCNVGSSSKLFCELAKTIAAVTNLRSFSNQSVDRCILESLASSGALLG